MMAGENKKTMFSLCHPLHSPLPPICLSPLRNLSIPLFLCSCIPLLQPSPPPLLFLSMWMALYHSASPLSLYFSLSLSQCVQSCIRLETCIVESACVWVHRKTHLRRTMRELLELFCIVSTGAHMFCFVFRSLFSLYQWIRGQEWLCLWTFVYCYAFERQCGQWILCERLLLWSRGVTFIINCIKYQMFCLMKFAVICIYMSNTIYGVVVLTRIRLFYDSKVELTNVLTTARRHFCASDCGSRLHCLTYTAKTCRALL